MHIRCLESENLFKYRGGSNRYISQDKSHLKEEVERKLDEIFSAQSLK